MATNRVFSAALGGPNIELKGKSTNLAATILTLFSYVFTHASASGSPRALSYAHLSLQILLLFVESPILMERLTEPGTEKILICRQVSKTFESVIVSLNKSKRIPALPIASASRPELCAVLDCCVLWLRHNLRKSLEINSYKYVWWFDCKLTF
jgi:hypothetical protein